MVLALDKANKNDFICYCARLFVPLQKRKGYEMETHDNHATSLFVGCNIGR